MWTLFRIALRNVLRNRRRTLITLGALVVGVGTTITIRGLLTGLQEAQVEQVVFGQTGAIQVHRAGYLKNVLSNPLDLDFDVAALAAQVRAVPGVTGTSGRLQFAGFVNADDETLFLRLLGVDPVGEFEVAPLRRETLEAGTTFEAKQAGVETDPAKDGAVVLTTDLAKSFGLKQGEAAALLAPDKDGALNGENVVLGGLMVLKVPGEKKIGLVPLSLAQRLLRMEGRATELVVNVATLADVPRVQAALATALGPGFEVSRWDEIATFINQTQGSQDQILKLVIAIFMVLMLLGVANTMLMSVLERTREVGTLMAVGVRRSKIVLLFLFEALGLGVLGGVLGGVVGAAVVAFLHGRGIVFQSPGNNAPFTLRPEVTPAFLVTVVVVAAVGAVVFSIYPAWRASRLRPVEALNGG